MSKHVQDFESRQPLKGERRDEEAQLDFTQERGPPQGQGNQVRRVVKEVKRNWWLWGAVAFAFVLITGVVMFRHKLYNTGNFGLPFIAVKENAAETCASKCKIGGSDDPLLQLEEGSTVTNKQEYDACYSRCVAQETKEVAEEREKFKENEEKFEKKVQEQLSGAADAAKSTASDAVEAAKDALPQNVKGMTDADAT